MISSVGELFGYVASDNGDNHDTSMISTESDDQKDDVKYDENVQVYEHAQPQTPMSAQSRKSIRSSIGELLGYFVSENGDNLDTSFVTTVSSDRKCVIINDENLDCEHVDSQTPTASQSRKSIRNFDEVIHDSSCDIVWLHIPVQRSKENDSHAVKVQKACVKSNAISELLGKFFVALEVATLYKYFVKFPILDLVAPDGAPGVRKLKRYRALSLLTLITAATMYACYVTLRTCAWEASCFTWERRLGVVARLSGKLITFFVILGLILMFRALTSYFHEIPWKVNIGWRRMHIDCMIIAGAWAAVHIIAHSIRVASSAQPLWSYEIYFIVTGFVLTSLFLSQYTPYFVLRFLQIFKATSMTLQYGMKWWFRHSHKQLFKVIALLYFFHASGDISPFAIYVVWLFCEYQFQLDVTHCTVRFTPSRQNYEYCELIATYTNKMPDEFGYYCRVSILDTFASYTQIPLEDGHTTIFKIKNSIQADKLLEYVNATSTNLQENEILFQNKSLNELNLQISGPFHSMEMTVKHSLTRHMICLVSGSGTSVSDSVSLFHKSRPGYWNSLTVIQLCGRNKGAAPTLEQLKGNISVNVDSAKSNKFDTARSSCRTIAHRLSEFDRRTNSGYIQSRSPTDLVTAIKDVIEQNQFSSCDKLHHMEETKNSSTMDIQIWGDLDDAYVTTNDGETISLAKALIQINHHRAYDQGHMKPHFIICSKQWTAKIEPYLTKDISQRCHIEEFDF